ncbi:CCE_0567 family metalloprotein [Frigidibacter sp.]|uniref:CCE_0567 family metalloprotein n=1 Tax=Frigidibacter sp. TaxID=2586418 RepID=UPI0027375A4D|nr:CCE_0567 family metalloprotein [Frigidibacter sp.]MDP3340367.1 CCE_0567 family metalloprotein [Frigidibacter sp.]
MSLEDLEAQVKKLSMRATDAKLALHDLSEELPIDWEKIPEVAERTWTVFRDLDAARKAVKDAKLAAKGA